MPTIISIPLNAGLTPPETQISVLSKRVERLSYVRGSLNDEYNSLSWICKMDNHIITEVLSHFYNNVTAPIRYGPGGLKTGGTYYGNPYKWITVTQVCRKLRRIALNTKQLWGTIWITRNSECVSEMLHRSGTSNLIVICQNRMRRPERYILDLILEALPRIEHFYMYNPQAIAVKDRRHIMDAPQLRSLIISLRTADHDPSSDQYIQYHLATCCLPSLERLEIHMYRSVLGDTLFRPTLKHLVLRAPPTDSDIVGASNRRPNVATLISALRDMPLLETLELEFVFQAPSEQECGGVAVVHLEYLRELRVLSQRPQSCAEFVERICPPNLACIFVQCDEGSKSETKRILAFMRSVCDRSLRIRTMAYNCLHHSSAWHTEIRGWANFHGARDLYRGNLPQPCLEVYLISTNRKKAESFTLGMDAMISDSLESLEIAGDEDALLARTGRWKNQITGLGKLRELCLGQVPKQDVFDLLGVEVNVGDRTPNSRKEALEVVPASRLALPHLQKLYLTDWCSSTREESAQRMAKLRECLRSRKRAGLALKLLVVRTSHEIGEEEIQRLNEQIED